MKSEVVRDFFRVFIGLVVLYIILFFMVLFNSIGDEGLAQGVISFNRLAIFIIGFPFIYFVEGFPWVLSPSPGKWIVYGLLFVNTSTQLYQ